MKIIFTCIVFSFFLGQSQPGSNWALEKREDGITIYTRQADDLLYKEFKAEMTVNASAEKVLDILLDADNFKNWMPGCRNSRLITKLEDNQQYNYVESRFPFPFENRDMVYKTAYTTSGDTEQITMVANPGYIEEYKNITRIKIINGKWEVIPQGGDKVLIRHQLYMEPGGSIPVWLVNLKIADHPYDTFKNLREFINR